MLRYFCEERKNLHVIAAGSMLETAIDFEKNFLVDRVEFVHLYPCTFKEFLIAKKEDGLIEALNVLPLPESLHSRLQDLFKEYTLLGGMPEVISTYINNVSVLSTRSIYESLILSYMDDMEKHSRSNSQASVVQQIIPSCFIEAGKRIKFEGFGNTNFRSREIKDAFALLEKAMLIKLMYPSYSVEPPITTNKNKSPKLFALDVGLINYYSGSQKEFFVREKLEYVYHGRISEHIVGQELAAYSKSILHLPSFWIREKKQSSAELDYIINHEGMVIPVEVKSGSYGTLRSLMLFVDAAPHKYAVRVYSGGFSREKQKTIAGKNFVLLNLPFYLVSEIDKYINLMIENY
ncbi:MAG: ATP-binding protein [Ignavibacteriaceae bacterium]|nr:ATP-binding protein [Ignavibacteriaceae bacterium]